MNFPNVPPNAPGHSMFSVSTEKTKKDNTIGKLQTDGDVVISGTLFSDPKYYYYSGAASKDQKVSEFQLSW